MAWIVYLPWAMAAAMLVVALVLLDRLLRAQRRTEHLAEELGSARMSLNLAESVGRIGSWRLDAERHDVVWSDEVFAIHERSHDRGHPTLEQALAYYHPDDRATVTAMVNRAMEECEDFDFRARIISCSGKVKPVLSRGVCQFDRDGKVRGVFGTFIDLSEPGR